ncbi:hypothetical protein Tco_1241923, partial [Tanacetum coccineum]
APLDSHFGIVAIPDAALTTDAAKTTNVVVSRLSSVAISGDDNVADALVSSKLFFSGPSRGF